MSTISCIEHPAECLCWECTGIADGNRCQGVIPSESSNDNDGSDEAGTDGEQTLTVFGGHDMSPEDSKVVMSKSRCDLSSGYKPGDYFIRTWDATAYVEEVGGQAAANEAWSDNYDEAAKQERLLKPHGQDAPVLMRELMPSAEFADDLLPLCSGPDTATYRISNVKRTLMVFGGVRLNMSKLPFMPIRRPRTIVITAGQIERYADSRDDWYP